MFSVVLRCKSLPASVINSFSVIFNGREISWPSIPERIIIDVPYVYFLCCEPQISSSQGSVGLSKCVLLLRFRRHTPMLAIFRTSCKLFSLKTVDVNCHYALTLLVWSYDL